MSESNKNLDKNQKLALIGLTFFGICLIVIWVFNLNNEIRGPLNPKVSAADNTASATTQTSDDKLKRQDTDGDGLSDYDEINVYHTSPYIADSDSDGIPHGIEIAKGTDPNCPQGKDCSATTIAAAPVSTSTTISSPNTSNAINESALTAGTAVESSSSDADAASSALLSGQLTAAQLRQLLISSGQVNKTDLDKISDADLLKAYQDQLSTNPSQ
jgi:hypothetical protein